MLDVAPKAALKDPSKTITKEAAGALGGDLDAFLRDEGGERHEAHNETAVEGMERISQPLICFADNFALQLVVSPLPHPCAMSMALRIFPQ